MMKKLLGLIIIVVSGILLVVLATQIQQNQTPEDSSAGVGLEQPFYGIPESTATIKNPGKWSFTIQDKYTPGSLEYWSEYELNQEDERKAFHVALIHKEGAQNSWEARLTGGGAIYSLITKKGELIGEQSLSGPWMDRVIQSVMIDSSKESDENHYFIHQAGTYARDGMQFPFYSPILEEVFDKNENSYTTISWPQQAHIPTFHKSEVLLTQKIRDLGDGVIELTYIYNNFGEDTFSNIAAPWMALQKEMFTQFVESNQDGSYKYVFPERWDKNILFKRDSNGWVAVTERQSGISDGIGLVFGKDKHFELIGHSKPRIRWGPSRTRNLIILSTGPSVKAVKPGENFFYRYYIIINRLRSIENYGNEMTDLVDYGHVIFTEDSTKLNPICKRENSKGKTVYYNVNCHAGDSPLFYTYKNAVSGSKPLFLLKNTVLNKYVITTDPYEITGITKNCDKDGKLIDCYRPYDGKTEYLGFLGWAVQEKNANKLNYDYKEITELINNRSLYPASTSLAKSLVVRTSQEKRCQPNCAGKECGDNGCGESCGSCTGEETCSNGKCIVQNKTCTNSNWSFTLTPSTCPVNETQTRKWFKVENCEGGIEKPTSETISCTFNTPTCSSFTYSSWSECSEAGIQTRTLTSSSPENCEGGNPVLEQNCTYVPPTGVECGVLDINGDDKLTLVDFTNFTSVYGKTCTDSPADTGCGKKDSNGNGQVDLFDFVNFSSKYGLSSCSE